MSENVNLDSKKQSRVSKKKRPTVTFNGKNFFLPKELPFEIFRKLEILSAQEDKKPEDYTPDEAAEFLEELEAMLRLLFDDQTEAFLAEGPSLPDILALFDGVMDLFGDE